MYTLKSSMTSLLMFFLFGCMGSNQMAIQNNQATAATLKAVFFAEQTMFQASGYADSDSTFRYGFIDELAAVSTTIGGKQFFRHAKLVGSVVVAKGYCYKVYLPKGADDAYARGDTISGSLSQEEGNLIQRHFIVYAWPVDKTAGTRLFAMGSDGKICAEEHYDFRFNMTNVPKWNEAFGSGGTWASELSWPMYTGEK